MAEPGQCIDADTDYDAFRRTEEERSKERRERMLTMFGITENGLGQLVILQFFSIRHVMADIPDKLLMGNYRPIFIH